VVTSVRGNERVRRAQVKSADLNSAGKSWGVDLHSNPPQTPAHSGTWPTAQV
jgi:hypothetical protein